MRISVVACLYVIIVLMSCSTNDKKITIDHTSIENYSDISRQNDTAKFSFPGYIEIHTKEYELKEGKYTLHLTAETRTPEKRSSFFWITFGPHIIRQILVGSGKASQKINFELAETTKGRFTFRLSPDDKNLREDPNLYIYYPIVVTPY